MAAQPPPVQQSQMPTAQSGLAQTNDHLKAIRILVRAAFDCSLTIFVFGIAAGLSFGLLRGAVIGPVLFGFAATVIVVIKALAALKATAK